MVNTRGLYQPHMITAARQVLLELAYVLEEDLDKIVFVGGTACALLFPQDTDPHEGTIDVDIALNLTALADAGLYTLEEKLFCANFQQDALKVGETSRSLKKYRWYRTAHIDGTPQAYEIAVELLSGEYEDSHRFAGSREVQGVHASVLRGLDLAFLDPRLVPLAGLLPDGSAYETTIQVCSPASLLAMKGIAIGDRLQGADKDAFDIDYILRRFEGGPAALARVLQIEIDLDNGLVQEGLQGIAKAFQSLDAVGPTSVASSSRYLEAGERAIVQQGAFLRVQSLLQTLKIVPLP